MFISLTLFNFSLFSIFLWISYLVITDDRFLLNRKILFLLLLVILGFISLYIDKAPYDIINDLFWYSLILNGSFIFHTLILDRIFHYCWKNHYEYMGFLISRISFTLSLSGLSYFLDNLKHKLIPFFYDFALTFYNEDKLIIIKKKQPLYYWYIYLYRNFIWPYFLLKFIFDLIKFIIHNSINILRIILINFSIIFNNYSLLILGKNINTFNKDLIIKSVFIFLVFFFISLIINQPRLYVIWLFQGLLECYKIFNLEYNNSIRQNDLKNLNIIGKIIYIYNNFKKLTLLYNCYQNKYEILEKIYEKPYHTFFMFDLCKFLSNKHTDGYYSKWGGYDESFTFPLDKIYKFYPWEQMAMGYIKSSDLYYKLFADHYENVPFPIREEEERWEEALMWLDLINRSDDYKLFKNLLDQDITDENLTKKFYE